VLLSLIGLWLGLNLLLGVYLVWARPSERADPRRRTTLRVLAAGLTAAIVLLGVTAEAPRWSSAPLLGTLLAFALASDALPVTTSIFRSSGSFLALVLAAALLGPAPAVLIGIACTAVDAIRRRARSLNLLINLVAFTTVPLVVGLTLSHLEGRVTQPAYAAAVFVAALIADLANFGLVATPMCFVERRPVLPLMRASWAPVAPWVAATACVGAITAYTARTSGTAAVIVALPCLLGLQLGVRALVVRRQRSGRLPARPELRVTAGRSSRMA
jgi:hypothetical protein